MNPPVVHPGDLVVERAVDLLAAMAHPTRLAVLLWLHRRGPTAVGDLVVAFDSEQSAMSHHLSLLRARRLVTTERQGKRVLYRLVDAHVGCMVEDAVRHAAEVPPTEGRGL